MEEEQVEIFPREPWRYYLFTYPKYFYGYLFVEFTIYACSFSSFFTWTESVKKFLNFFERNFPKEGEQYSYFDVTFHHFKI